MARQKYVLPRAKRDEVIAWAKEQYEKKTHRSEYGSFFKAVHREARALLSLLDEDSTPAAVLDEQLRKRDTDRDKVSVELVKLLASARPYMPPGRSGTLVEVDHNGRAIKGRQFFRNTGKQVKGRRESNPLFQALVDKLLEESGGRLTHDKNNGKGSLTDTLKGLRTEIPYVIPPAVPHSTIGKIVKAYRRRLLTGQEYDI